MYTGPAFNSTRWYQCLGNHDVVKGQSGVTFETQIAPLYDSRWYFGTEGLPYYTYNLQGNNWNATFVVLDSDCFISKYQESSSHNGVVLNGHDHCLAHFYNNNTNFILAGGAGYPQAGDCNNGISLGPYTKWLGANAEAAANGFVTMDISKESVVVEYYARDMRFEGGDLYPVKNDLSPSYTFTITQHAS
ncbi:hypothetical protein H0H92_011906 [Tricholoma furcatifolium]|nr:hypothetical protein H0H92_011906 [Tricholoma furcatifolium]